MSKNDERMERAFELREVRKLAGLTVSEVAARAHLDRTTISTYEARRAAASADALARWECSLAELVRERGVSVQLAVNSLASLATQAA